MTGETGCSRDTAGHNGGQRGLAEGRRGHGLGLSAQTLSQTPLNDMEAAKALAFE